MGAPSVNKSEDAGPKNAPRDEAAPMPPAPMPSTLTVTLERVLATGLAAIGAGIAVGGYASTGWQERSAFQISLGAIICVCSAATLLKSQSRVRALRDETAPTVKLRARPRLTWRPDVSLPATFFVLFAAYIALVQVTNFFIASAVFGVVYLWTFFNFAVWRAAAVSLLVSAATHWVFVRLLGVPFS
jgi:hypothetical protein